MRWPDIVITLAVLFGAWRGWRRGLIAELTGTVAFAIGIAAAFAYPSMWDGAIGSHTHLGPGSAHVVAMLVYSGLAYAIVHAVGNALGTVAKLPLVGTANAGVGALVGAVQACVFLWAVLYVALFFPLSRDLRDDLSHSKLVTAMEVPNSHLDGTLRSSLPWFVRPFASGIFARHRV